MEPQFNSSTYQEPPTFDTTAERLRWRAQRVGPWGLDYISAAELNAIADELERNGASNGN